MIGALSPYNREELESTVKDYGLLLKTTRESRGLTQEQAAEAVGVSVDSWYAYESNKRLPPMNAVNRICHALDAQWLAMYFLEAHAQGADVLPEVHARELPTAVLTLLNRVLAFSENCRARQLMEMAEDGVIDEVEQAVYDEIVAELDGIIEAALAVKYPKGQKKNRLDAGTSKRLSVSGTTENNRKIILSHSAGNASPNFARKGGAFL